MALNGYFYDLYEQIAAQLQQEVQTQLDQLLVVPPDRVVSPFESFKADAMARARSRVLPEKAAARSSRSARC
jgi:hypothetical protein